MSLGVLRGKRVGKLSRLRSGHFIVAALANIMLNSFYSNFLATVNFSHWRRGKLHFFAAFHATHDSSFNECIHRCSQTKRLNAHCLRNQLKT